MSENNGKQAERGLKLCDKELAKFAHVVVCDLKAFAPILGGFIELAIENHRSDEQIELEKILEAMTAYIHKLDSIVDSIKFVADVCNQEVKVEPLDMATIVSNALERISDLVKRYQAEVVTPNDSYPVVLGIPQWVEEIWIAYCKNGLIYGGSPPRLDIGFMNQEDDHVKFWVKDNSKVFSPEELQRLWGSQERTNDLGLEGSNLVWFIVQRIVEKLNGQVAFESTPGEGSTFSFTLPRA